ncbi:MAG: aminomethyl-transferring glycine dehydrogenase subunit GcvPA [Candidatus Promineifilaceae bacterium]
MTHDKTIVYPYIPNSAPQTKAEMLRATGAKGTDDFYEDVPEKLRLRRKLNLPNPLLSEAALERHVRELLDKNETAVTHLNFLGAGCYQHHVPAVCDEVNQRGEFLTAYAGEPYDDHGRFQALFEYCSMMGDLLNMDVVNVPIYDGFQAAATAVRMASRLTGRYEALLPRTIMPGKLSKIRDYCKTDMTIRLVDTDTKTGQMDLESLQELISEETGTVYFDNPSYFGIIETQGQAISDIAHEHGALCVVGADPISLGVLTPPADYGADIVCGDIQPLGIPMNYGGGLAGFIASHDDERVVMEYPSRLFGIAPTRVPGEYGFGDVAYERTSFAIREEGKEWVGTAAALWGITAGVYLALMGPQGMADIGQSIMARARYAAMQLNKIPGVQAPLFEAPHFKEFVVNFDQAGISVAEINEALLARGIFGGKDLSHEFPHLAQSALYCVTEIHTQADIDHLARTIQEVLER